ncbi:hypothetical protein TorRG33x02_319630, partial [Trema orientale]
MNMMLRAVLNLSFPLDTWAVTKHLRGELDAIALNRFRRDEQNRLTMWDARSWLRISPDAGPSAEPSSMKKGTAAPRARPKVPAGRRVVVSSKDEAAGSGAAARREDSGDELEGLFVSGDDIPPAPLPGAGGPTTQEATAIKVKYGRGSSSGQPTTQEATAIKIKYGGGSSGQPKESLAATPPVARLGSTASAGFGSARSHGGIAELSEWAPRLKSRLSFSLSLAAKRGREADPSEADKGSVAKRGRTAPSSDSEDDGVTLTVLRRKRSARHGPSERAGQDKTKKLQVVGSAPQVVGSAPQVIDGAAEAVTVLVTADDASARSAPSPSSAIPTPPSSAVSGGVAEVLRAEGGALPLGGEEVRASGADGTRGSDSATELQLEPLSLENVDAVASRSLAQ